MNKSAWTLIRNTAEDLLHNRKMIIRILVILLILLMSVVLRIHESGKADITVDAAEDASAAGAIYVDIGGAVVKPGVYQATTDMRLFEVIEMAGGLRSDADTDSINQAEFVVDGEKIIIPVHNDIDSEDMPESQNVNDIASVPAGNGLININTASKEELKTLDGIGDVMAERIIEFRTERKFKSIEDIKSVKGIGDAVFNKIKDSITI